MPAEQRPRRDSRRFLRAAADSISWMMRLPITTASAMLAMRRGRLRRGCRSRRRPAASRACADCGMRRDVRGRCAGTRHALQRDVVDVAASRGVRRADALRRSRSAPAGRSASRPRARAARGPSLRTPRAGSRRRARRRRRRPAARRRRRSTPIASIGIGVAHQHDGRVGRPRRGTRAPRPSTSRSEVPTFSARSDALDRRAVGHRDRRTARRVR
jgi:hypothetical protein